MAAIQVVVAAAVNGDYMLAFSTRVGNDSRQPPQISSETALEVLANLVMKKANDCCSGSCGKPRGMNSFAKMISEVFGLTAIVPKSSLRGTTDWDLDFGAALLRLGCPLDVSGLESWLPEDDWLDFVDD